MENKDKLAIIGFILWGVATTVLVAIALHYNQGFLALTAFGSYFVLFGCIIIRGAKKSKQYQRVMWAFPIFGAMTMVFGLFFQFMRKTALMVGNRGWTALFLKAVW